LKPLSPKIRVEVEPYSKLAYIYDDIMSHVDYELWSKYILKIIDKFGKKVDSILDVSCGTANLLLCLKSKRYHLVGFDFSSDMIKVARAKLRSDSDVHLYQGDMTLFYLNKKFDVILCLYDSVNYLMDFNLWQSLFECVYDVINNDGLFIFDICTRKNSIKYFDKYVEKSGGLDYEYIRESKYNRIKNIHQNKFIINFDKSDQIFVEYHKQRIYAVDEVLKFISHTPFTLLGSFDGFSFQKGSEQSLRVHFVLER